MPEERGNRETESLVKSAALAHAVPTHHDREVCLVPDFRHPERLIIELQMGIK
jgi:hypothetical protein